MENNIQTDTSRIRNVEAFLTSLEIRRRLSETDASEDAISTEPANSEFFKTNPCHPFPFAGQVRVLKDVTELTYVLLARKWDADSFLVIPFSHFNSPATDMELAVARKGGLRLSVLQIWNVRTLRTETLRRGWVAGILPEQDISDALELWNSFIGIAEPSERLLPRTGLPIVRGDDPRLKYQEDAIANFAKIDAMDLALAERDDSAKETESTSAFIPSRPFADYVRREGYALAAADAEQAVTANCRVKGIDGIVRVNYNRVENTLRLRSFDVSGNRSSMFDGWGVLGSKAEVLGYFRGDSCVASVAPDFDLRVSLLDFDGVAHPLTAKEE